MMSYRNFVKKSFLKVCRKNNMSPKEIKNLTKIGNTMEQIIWGIARFICMYYIYLKIYERIGFERAILLALVYVVVLLRSNLRPKFIE